IDTFGASAPAPKVLAEYGFTVENLVKIDSKLEMGASQNWYKYVGLDGAVLGIDTFGASAPAPKVLAEYGFTVENLVKIDSKLE
ncbi:hypothetical protein CSW78_28485, partial [Shigella flexneri]